MSVAQVVRALDCGSSGRGFKSRHSPHLSCRTRSSIGQSNGLRIHWLGVRVLPGALKMKIMNFPSRAPLAQLAEHLTLNQGVEGSIPSRRTIFYFGRVLEVGDKVDLGSTGLEAREGSSPSSPTIPFDPYPLEGELLASGRSLFESRC